MSLFNPSRDQVRQFFFDAWTRFRAQQALSNIEALAVSIMQAHPEYHGVLDQPERYLQQAYFPEMGETNPFLHMSLHLSVLEQISIDQPPSIAAAYAALLEQEGDAQAAQHALMDCLAEVVWQAQRNQQPLDALAYIASLRRRAGLHVD
ncbi:DUF1841 family protein [Pseudomethylobacillus aquaticus]|uniref:DUF1841 family protein n=1 Tax=Pseudomethylobacillus aquaticus TaxID=2676064 RepID=A0A3N0V6U3_9PROT|nr:DUF1841 family protein [Pseudomethylobacillus aquaticus]ROH88520.1 DUF1841 family protein [Pseudomethylobacillus aquaticus]